MEQKENQWMPEREWMEIQLELAKLEYIKEIKNSPKKRGKFGSYRIELPIRLFEHLCAISQTLKKNGDKQAGVSDLIEHAIFEYIDNLLGSGCLDPQSFYDEEILKPREIIEKIVDKDPGRKPKEILQIARSSYATLFKHMQPKSLQNLISRARGVRKGKK